MAASPEALELALPFLVGLSLTAMAVFVLRVGRRRLDHGVFGFLYLLSGVKSFAEGLLPVANGLQAEAPAFPGAHVWLLLQFVCAAFMLPLLFLFFLLFPRPVQILVRHRSISVLLFLPSLACLYLLFVQPSGVSLGDIALGLNVAATVLTALAVVAILRTLGSTRDPIERTQARYLLVGFAPAFVGTWILTALDLANVLKVGGGSTSLLLQSVLVHFATPFFELLAAGVTAYAIVKYQLLGIEFKIRTGLRYAVTTTLLFGTLFTANGWVEENVLEPVFGFTNLYWLLAGIVGVALFKPIERLAQWVTDRLVPSRGSATSAYRNSRAAEIYHAQCSYVLRDANVTDREMALLRNLRTQLGLSATEARRIEDKVERILRVDSPRTGSTRRSRGSRA